MLTPQQLCEAFVDRAAAVRALIDFSYSRGLGVSEETLTDLTLVELERHLSPHVVTRKFTKHEESSLSGADWLWSIGRPGRWFSILVQAKLARPNRPNLHGLHHGKGSQRQTLVSHAAAERCMPLYIVYTGSSVGNKVTARCPMHGANPALSGCSAVRTRHIANLFRRNKKRANVAALLGPSWPLSCFFCCPAHGQHTELADAAFAAIAALPMPRFEAPRRRRGSGRVRGGNPEGETFAAPPTGEEETTEVRSPRAGMSEGDEDDDWLGDLENPEALITSRAPELVEAILRGRDVVKPNVGIVTIISSEPIARAPL